MRRRPIGRSDVGGMHDDGLNHSGQASRRLAGRALDAPSTLRVVPHSPSFEGNQDPGSAAGDAWPLPSGSAPGRPRWRSAHSVCSPGARRSRRSRGFPPARAPRPRGPRRRSGDPRRCVCPPMRSTFRAPRAPSPARWRLGCRTGPPPGRLPRRRRRASVTARARAARGSPVRWWSERSEVHAPCQVPGDRSEHVAPVKGRAWRGRPPETGLGELHRRRRPIGLQGTEEEPVVRPDEHRSRSRIGWPRRGVQCRRRDRRPPGGSSRGKVRDDRQQPEASRGDVLRWDEMRDVHQASFGRDGRDDALHRGDVPVLEPKSVRRVMTRIDVPRRRRVGDGSGGAALHLAVDEEDDTRR